MRSRAWHGATYSLVDIARACGVSFQMIQQVEQRALRKIRTAIEAEADAAGVTVDVWLFGESRPDSSDRELQRFLQLIEAKR